MASSDATTVELLSNASERKRAAGRTPGAEDVETQKLSRSYRSPEPQEREMKREGKEEKAREREEHDIELLNLRDMYLIAYGVVPAIYAADALQIRVEEDDLAFSILEDFIGGSCDVVWKWVSSMNIPTSLLLATECESGEEKVPRLFEVAREVPDVTKWAWEAHVVFSFLDFSPTIYEKRMIWPPDSSPTATPRVVLELAPSVDMSLQSLLLHPEFPTDKKEELRWIRHTVDLVVDLLREVEFARMVHGHFQPNTILVSFQPHVEIEVSRTRRAARDRKFDPSLPRYQEEMVKSDKGDPFDWPKDSIQPTSVNMSAFENDEKRKKPDAIKWHGGVELPRWLGLIDFAQSVPFLFFPWIDVLTLILHVRTLLEAGFEKVFIDRIQLFYNELTAALDDSYSSKSMGPADIPAGEVSKWIRADTKDIEDKLTQAWKVLDARASAYWNSVKKLSPSTVVTENWCGISVRQAIKVAERLGLEFLEPKLNKVERDSCSILQTFLFSRVPALTDLVPVKYFGSGAFGAVLGFSPAAADGKLVSTDITRLRVFKLWIKTQIPGEYERQLAFSEFELAPRPFLSGVVTNWTWDSDASKVIPLHLIEMQRIHGTLWSWLGALPEKVARDLFEDRKKTEGKKERELTLGNAVLRFYKQCIGEIHTLLDQIFILMTNTHKAGFTHGDPSYGNMGFILRRSDEKKVAAGLDIEREISFDPEAKKLSAHLVFIDMGQSTTKFADPEVDWMNLLRVTRARIPHEYNLPMSVANQYKNLLEVVNAQVFKLELSETMKGRIPFSELLELFLGEAIQTRASVLFYVELERLIRVIIAARFPGSVSALDLPWGKFHSFQKEQHRLYLRKAAGLR